MDTIRDSHEGPARSNTTPTAKPSRRGFSGMSPERHRALASQGGKTAHARHRAHEFSSEEARRAGQRGGEQISKNREHMATIGRKGGLARKRRAASAQTPLASAQTPLAHAQPLPASAQTLLDSAQTPPYGAQTTDRSAIATPLADGASDGALLESELA